MSLVEVVGRRTPSPVEVQEYVIALKTLKPFCTDMTSLAERHFDHILDGDRVGRVKVMHDEAPEETGVKPGEAYALMVRNASWHNDREVTVEKEYGVNILFPGTPYEAHVPYYDETFCFKDEDGDERRMQHPVAELIKLAQQYMITGNLVAAVALRFEAELIKRREAQLQELLGDGEFERHLAFMGIVRTIQDELGVEPVADE